MVLSMAAVLALPVMAPAIAADTGLAVISPRRLVRHVSCAMVGSSLAGELIARLGPMRVVQLSLALSAVALGCGAIGWTPALAVVPPLVGVACAIETPASSDILARVTRPKHRTFIFSLKQTGVQVGGMLAGIVYPAALPALGWRGALAALAAMMLAWAFALEPMRRRLDAGSHARRPPAGGSGRLALVWRHRGLRDLATASFVFHAMQICLNTFLVAYLVGEHGFSLAAAGLALAVAQFGGFVGRLGFWLIIGPRLGVMTLLLGIGFGMTAAALATGLAAGVLSPLALWCLCFLFGLTAGWNGVFLAEVAREAPPGEIARVTGGVMISAYAGLIFGPVAFSAAATAAATLGAGYLLLAGATFAGALVLRRAGHERPRAV
jgi:predicted MFS family arabinose efflux permease